MKTIAILTALLLASFNPGQVENTEKFIVNIPNVTSANEEVLFARNSRDCFMNKEPDFAAKSGIRDREATVIFKNVPENTYSIVVLHSEKENCKMDIKAGGMPLENYSISGNSMVYGLSNRADSNFKLDGTEKKIGIKF